MNRTLRIGVAGAVGIVVFLVTWELFVRAFDVRPFVLQAPSEIVRELADNPELYLREAWVTVRHAVLGLSISLVASLVLPASR